MNTIIPGFSGGCSKTVLTVMLFATAPLFSAVVGEDTFDGPAGRPLHGAVIAKYDTTAYSIAPVWSASPNLVYADTENQITSGTDGSAEIKLPVANRVDGHLILKASIKVQTADWGGLGFLASESSNFFDPNNTLTVLLTARGYVQVLKNGERLLYSSATPVAGWNPEGTHAVEVRYDRYGGVVNVLVNGGVVNPEPIRVGELAHATFAAVGLRLHGAKIKAGVPLLDNFSYEAR